MGRDEKDTSKKKPPTTHFAPYSTTKTHLVSCLSPLLLHLSTSQTGVISVFFLILIAWSKCSWRGKKKSSSAILSAEVLQFGEKGMRDLLFTRFLGDSATKGLGLSCVFNDTQASPLHIAENMPGREKKHTHKRVLGMSQGQKKNKPGKKEKRDKSPCFRYFFAQLRKAKRLGLPQPCSNLSTHLCSPCHFFSPSNRMGGEHTRFGLRESTSASPTVRASMRRSAAAARCSCTGSRAQSALNAAAATPPRGDGRHRQTWHPMRKNGTHRMLRGCVCANYANVCMADV